MLTPSEINLAPVHTGLVFTPSGINLAPVHTGLVFTTIKSNLCLVGEPIEEITKKYSDKVPDFYKDNRIKRDGQKHHMTIHYNSTNQQIPENTNIYPLGFGCDKNKEVYYVVIYYPAGEKISNQYFHITLGFKTIDLHDFPKNIATACEYENMEYIVDVLLKNHGIPTLRCL